MEILDFFYTESQLARTLGVNRLTVCRWVKEDRFNIQRVGREVLIPKWEVELLKVSKRCNRRKSKYQNSG